jgi:hypothetical protein
VFLSIVQLQVFEKSGLFKKEFPQLTQLDFWLMRFPGCHKRLELEEKVPRVLLCSFSAL